LSHIKSTVSSDFLKKIIVVDDAQLKYGNCEHFQQLVQ